MQRIRRKAGPKNESIRRRFARSYSEPERIMREARTGLRPSGSNPRGGADRRLQKIAST